MLVHGTVQYPQDHSLHRLSCPHKTVSPPMTKHKLGFLLGLSILFLAFMQMSCVPLPSCLDDGRFAVYLEIRQRMTSEICTSC